MTSRVHLELRLLGPRDPGLAFPGGRMSLQHLQKKMT